MKKVVILGSNGMLGHSLLKNIKNCQLYGIQRKASEQKNIITINDFFSNELYNSLDILSPDVIINCVGVIKQKNISNDVLHTLPINSIFPHLLAQYTEKNNSRLIHFSTDCIFDGKEGMYGDEHEFSAKDLYGISKYLGEIKNNPSTLTLRVSIIGHGIEPNDSLIDWFISQNGTEVKGYTKAYFSGLPCKEIANILTNYIIYNEELFGLYNLSADRISKFDLLKLVAQKYHLNIKINECDSLVIDRSLNSERFKKATGYKNKTWPELIGLMKEDYNEL
ncbi:dTDP-4-dehydrorhamnose reductase family protein [Providencia stuartii]|uniref:dTDP-4-dehydrorhamnose reductase family protein n=1 Tax=Providencia stuartii TaxID=588 RepID=UPI0024AB951A|nr:SDR family oxidoreductase [Providencia stuartii]MCR4081618.1 SDR family oxidoreductase [Providencia stuartii]MDX7494643.1 SDR family oxidoreductase [Providencia stuartii]